MEQDKHTFFEGKTFRSGGSLVVIIPNSVCDYLGIGKGDRISANIKKVEKG